MATVLVDQKQCRRCLVVKNVGEFYAERRNRDGLHSYCKACNRERSRTHPNKRARQARYYRENRDKILADHAQWRAANLDRIKATNARWYRDHPEHVQARRREYYLRNKVRMRAATQAWTAANGDRARAYQREWRRLNRDSVRVWEARRRARRRAAQVVKFTAAELADRWAYYGDRCWICRAEATQTDHVKPLAKGGAHMLSNLRPVCASCNGAKRDRWPL